MVKFEGGGGETSSNEAQDRSIISMKEEEEASYCSSIRRDWSQIGDDIFGLILQRLSLTHYLRTQAVCSSWRSIVARSIVHNNKYPHHHRHPPSLLPELPLVFLETDDPERFSFFNISKKSVFHRTSSSRPEYYGSIQGWLIMGHPTSSGSRSIFFLNPLTKAEVLMRSRLECGVHMVKKIVASAKPGDPSCVVACLFVDSNKIPVSGISDESWTLIKVSTDERNIFKEVEILNGKLYALSNEGLDSLTVCDLQNKPLNPKLLRVKHRSATADTILVQFFALFENVFRYLAVDYSSSCGGELLLVDMFYRPKVLDGDNIVGGINKDFILLPKFLDSQVYKFNEEKEEWIEVNNLGDRMLFVGRHKSFAMSNIGAIQGPKDLIKGNRIYFTCEDPKEAKVRAWKGIRIGRHCQTDKKTDYLICERFLNSDRVISSAWFMPSFW